MKILTLPCVELFLKSRKVTEFGDELIVLVTKMIESMDKNNGIGIAANQVGVLKDIFIMKTKEGENMVIINPVVLAEGGYYNNKEGCLSIPNVVYTAKRPSWVSLQYQDIVGEVKELMTRDRYIASIISHEMDHLNGYTLDDYTNNLDGLHNFTKNRGGSIPTSLFSQLKSLNSKFKLL